MYIGDGEFKSRQKGRDNQRIEMKINLLAFDVSTMSISRVCSIYALVRFYVNYTGTKHSLSQSHWPQVLLVIRGISHLLCLFPILLWFLMCLQTRSLIFSPLPNVTKFVPVFPFLKPRSVLQDEFLFFFSPLAFLSLS